MNRDWHDMSLNELASAIFAKLSGDGDGHGEGTRAEVDHAIPSHPVIRIRTGNRDSGGTGGVGLPSVYDIAIDDNGNKFFVNRYFEVSGVTMEGPQGSSSWYFGSYVAIRLLSSGGSGSSIVAYNSLGAMQAAQRDQDYVVIPLYKFDSDGNVECDLRHMPRADMWSLGLPSGTSS